MLAFSCHIQLSPTLASGTVASSGFGWLARAAEAELRPNISKPVRSPHFMFVFRVHPCGHYPVLAHTLTAPFVWSTWAISVFSWTRCGPRRMATLPWRRLCSGNGKCSTTTSLRWCVFGVPSPQKPGQGLCSRKLTIFSDTFCHPSVHSRRLRSPGSRRHSSPSRRRPAPRPRPLPSAAVGASGAAAAAAGRPTRRGRPQPHP